MSVTFDAQVLCNANKRERQKDTGTVLETEMERYVDRLTDRAREEERKRGRLMLIEAQETNMSIAQQSGQRRQTQKLKSSDRNSERRNIDRLRER